jgi:hypothetical protein
MMVLWKWWMKKMQLQRRGNQFVKNYIVTYVDAIGGNMKALVTFMNGAITMEYTFD